VYDKLSPRMKELLPDLVDAYSREHYAGIQAANREAWGKYAAAGVKVTRLSEEDAARFRKVAIPLWFKWANINKDAARLFKLHLECMQDPAIAMITPDDIKGFELKI
ncbi:MAG: ABC transporter substrate-binding protein, partial [Rhodospirillales bacterium]|nr:ABC transporter substrate-binding protein [Rhodospirillales bacterium]